MADNYTPGPVRGVKTTNSAAPTGDNVGALVAIANASAPSYTEGNEVLLSTDLTGNLRVTFGGTVSENLAQVNGVTVLTGAGATGTGSQRITVAQDTTTVAGSAPGTAGTPSSNVISVQGVTGGTGLTVSQATAANLNATVTQGATAWVDNLTQVGGTSVLTNSGAVGAGSLRVTLATGTGLGAAGATPILNQQVNGAGTATDMNSGAVGATTPRVTLATGGGLGGTLTTQLNVQISNGSSAIGATFAAPIYTQLSDGTTNADFGIGAAGTHTLRTTLGTGGGLGGLVTTPIFAELSDGTNALGTLTNPIFVDNTGTTGASKFSTLTSASLAAAGSVTLAGAAITTGKTGYLQQVTVSSSIMQKVTIQTYNGTTATTLAVLFVQAEEAFVWKASTNLMYPFTGGATDVYQVVIKNMDTAAADVYATLEWIEQ